MWHTLLGIGFWSAIFAIVWRRRRGHRTGNPFEVINQIYLARPRVNPESYPPYFETTGTTVVPKEQNPRAHDTFTLPHHPGIRVTLPPS